MRRDQIIAAIDMFRPKSIVETGTWKGYNAIAMLNAAKRHHDNPSYFGYDLFEDATEQTDKDELNVKHHSTLNGARAKILRKTEIDPVLIKGNTRETLQVHKDDFAFIDGGHSIETIHHDYEKLKGCKVVMFDDYYTPDSEGKCPDITKYGCNEIVKNLNHIVLPSTDQVQGGGIVHLVLVI